MPVPVPASQPDALAWQPGVQDIYDLLTRFAPGASGNLPGTFTEETRPTLDQVARMISAATGDVAAEVGDQLVERLYPAARRVAALNTAIDILISYGPELIGTDATDVIDRLQSRFDASLARLRAAEERAESGGDDTDPGGSGDGGFVGSVNACFDGPRVPIGWRSPGW
jgi:hypothetical protein